jgi:hypothetical protein
MLNKITFRFCLSILTIFAFSEFAFSQTPSKQTAPPAAAVAAAKPKRTVVDFFLLLPNKYVSNLSRAAREKRLKKFGTIDVGNGYLEILPPEEKQPNIYAAIFKRDAGDYVVAIETGTYGNGKKFRYDFLEHDGKTWIDVSKKVLPANFKFSDYGEDGNGCELPRFNRTITCRDAEGKLIYLGWTGKEFVIE